MIQFLPYVGIRPSSLSLYSRPETKIHRSEKQRYTELNLVHTDHQGLISFKAEKRIRNAIDWLLEITPNKKFYAPKYKKYYDFKINFITLTLASKQIHSDQVIKSQLLNHFLIECKKKWGVCNFLWRAESQRNGNIHFHVCTDRFIPWLELRNNWNRIQNKLGYVDRFHVKHRHRSPNSTDVHSIKKIKNIAAYLSKYCTKNSDNRSIEGKLWGLSTQLSRIKANVQMIFSGLADEIDKIADAFPKHVKVFDYATVIYCRSQDWLKMQVPIIKRLHENFIKAIRGDPDLVPVSI